MSLRNPWPVSGRHATRLETVWVDIPEDALEAWEAAIGEACGTVDFFVDDDTGLWRVSGVKSAGENEDKLTAACALAAMVSGVNPVLQREDVATEGWLERTRAAFPEQLIGRRYAIRGTHLNGPYTPGRITLTLDAGVAFGSGEHGSTRGCLRAFEKIAHTKPHNILDLGTGSGILAMAAAALLHRKVLATDIEPWSVRTTAENAELNGLKNRIHAIRADGWQDVRVRRPAPYDLIFANILARPLCLMAKHLAAHLAPGGYVILAGLLNTQMRMVLAAHRRHGLVLHARIREGAWSCLILRK